MSKQNVFEATFTCYISGFRLLVFPVLAIVGAFTVFWGLFYCSVGLFAVLAVAVERAGYLPDQVPGAVPLLSAIVMAGVGGVYVLRQAAKETRILTLAAPFPYVGVKLSALDQAFGPLHKNFNTAVLCSATVSEVLVQFPEQKIADGDYTSTALDAGEDSGG